MIKYRPDIDGLRAFAVIAVIIFHFNNAFLTGGFIGVDIFFVISGFIITMAIYPDIDKNRFSFISFYYRRIKRILPLVYFVSFSVVAYAYYLYTPNDFIGIADSIRYSSGFISNILFYKRIGYFAPASETVPLLHTWSLSIEEQFYLLFPVLLIGITKLFKFKGVVICLFFSLIGLTAYSQYSVLNNPSGAYLLIQNRGFELLVGAILAILLSKNKLNITDKNTLNIIGFASILILCCFYFFFNKNYDFPGVFALIVSLATAGVIFSGKENNTFVSKFLSIPALVYIGKISFSLYLWHWVVIAFYRYRFETFTLTGYYISLLIIIFLSLFSYYLIEKQLRYSRFNFKQTFLFFFVTPLIFTFCFSEIFIKGQYYFSLVLILYSVFVVFVNNQIKSLTQESNVSKRTVFLFYFFVPLLIAQGVAKTITSFDGIPERFNKESLSIYKYSFRDFNDFKDPSLQITPFTKEEGIDHYIIGDINQKDNPSAIIWGDSHAAHLRGAFNELGKKYHKSFIYAGFGGCPPILDLKFHKSLLSKQQCYNTNNAVIDFIKKSNIKNIIIAGRWSMYFNGSRSKNEAGHQDYAFDDIDHNYSIENNQRVVKKGIKKTISTLLSFHKNVFVVEQIPEFEFNSNNCLFKNKAFNLHESCNMDVLNIHKRQQKLDVFFSSLEKEFPLASFIKPSKYLCNNEVCFSFIKDTPIYKDDDHLNIDGSKILFFDFLNDNIASSQFKSFVLQ